MTKKLVGYLADLRWGVASLTATRTVGRRLKTARLQSRREKKKNGGKFFNGKKKDRRMLEYFKEFSIPSWLSFENITSTILSNKISATFFSSVNKYNKCTDI